MPKEEVKLPKICNKCAFMDYPPACSACCLLLPEYRQLREAAVAALKELRKRKASGTIINVLQAALDGKRPKETP